MNIFLSTTLLINMEHNQMLIETHLCSNCRKRVMYTVSRECSHTMCYSCNSRNQFCPLCCTVCHMRPKDEPGDICEPCGQVFYQSVGQTYIPNRLIEEAKAQIAENRKAISIMKSMTRKQRLMEAFLRSSDLRKKSFNTLRGVPPPASILQSPTMSDPNTSYQKSISRYSSAGVTYTSTPNSTGQNSNTDLPTQDQCFHRDYQKKTVKRRPKHLQSSLNRSKQNTEKSQDANTASSCSKHVTIEELTTENSSDSDS